VGAFPRRPNAVRSLEDAKDRRGTSTPSWRSNSRWGSNASPAKASIPASGPNSLLKRGSHRRCQLRIPDPQLSSGRGGTIPYCTDTDFSVFNPRYNAFMYPPGSAAAPAVSIVIPTRNRPDFLRSALESAVTQTFTDIEIIVVDDSDPIHQNDESSVIESFADERIVWIRNPKPLGQAGNINSGFDKARGEFLVLLHDDDILYPNCIEILFRIFEQDPATDIAFGKQKLLRSDGTVDDEGSVRLNETYRRHAQYSGRQPNGRISALTGQIPSNGWMVRSAHAREIRLRGREFVGDACDFDFSYRIVGEQGVVHFVDEFLHGYRVSVVSVSSARNYFTAFTYETIRDAVVPGEYEDLRRKCEGERAIRAAFSYLSHGRISESWRAWCSPNIPATERMSPSGVRFLALFSCKIFLRPWSHSRI